MNKANECTCPSGNGSLRHPCPAHPAVEQAGGDERDFQAEGAQEVPSPVSQEYDRHLISLLRKGEALPGHQEEAADEIERLRDWNDHLNNTVLPNILNPTFLMLMKGGERLLDLCTKDGEFIGVSLNDMKDVFDWMVTHARIAPDQAALAQPSPAQTQPSPAPTLRAAIDVANDRFEVPVAKWGTDLVGEEERPEVAEVAFVLRNIGAMDAEDIDGDNVDLRFEDAEGRDTGCDVSIVEYAEKAADLFEQHDRIVGELRAVIAQLRQHKNDYMDSGQETYRALQNEIREREAEIARLDGLVSVRTAERDAALARVAELEKQERPEGPTEDELEAAGLGYPLHKEEAVKLWYSGFRSEVITVLEAWEAIGHDIGMNPDKGELLDSLRYMLEKCEAHDAALARVAELERQQPVAWMHDQPNRVDVIHRDVKDLLQRVPGSSRGIHRPLDVSEHYTIPLYAAPVAQAQHSVPEGWMLVECGIWTQEQVDEMQKTVARFRNSEFVDDRALAMAVADAGQCKAPEISLAELLAAAPGKEGL